MKYWRRQKSRLGVGFGNTSKPATGMSNGFAQTIIIITVSVLVVLGGFLAFTVYTNRQVNKFAFQPSDNFGVQDIPLVGLFDPSSIGLSTLQSLSVNGQLRANNSLILTPTSRPTLATAGQMYYDQATNALAYYDGTEFVDFANSSDITDLQSQLTTLRSSVAGLGNTSVPEGIATQSGDNVFTGLNTFGALEATDLALSGSATLQGALSVNGSTTVASLTATNLTASGSVVLGATTISSLVLSVPLDVGSGGTGVTSLPNNGVVIGQGSSPLTTVNAAGAGLCLISTAGAPAFQACPGGGGSVVDSLNGLSGPLVIANASGLGATITIDDATTASKGIASFDTANFAVTGGAVTIKLGGVTGAEIADGTVTNTELQNSSLSVTAGNGLVNGGSVSLGGVTTLNIGQGDGIIINSDNVAVDTTVCRTSGNCTGVGGTGDILQGGNSFGSSMTIGTNDTNSLILETNNTPRLTITSAGAATFAGSVSGSSFSGDGSALTNLDASNLASGIVASGRLSGSYTGITGVGTVTAGSWQGTAIADTYLQDNITVSSAGSVDWAALNNYPAACAAGQAITQLGDTVTCTAFAAASGSGSYIQNGTGSQDTANFNIQSVATGSVTAKLRALAGQTADIIQVRDSGDAVTLFSVDSTGAVTGASFSGDGSSLTNLNGSNIATGTIVNGRLTGSGALTVAAGNGLLNGGSVSLGGSTTLNIGAGDGISVASDSVAVDGTVCRTSGNCAGVGGTGDILQGGNSFAAAMTIGTNDTQDLRLETDGVTRLTITSAGAATFTGSLAASTFSGDGAALTNLDASQLTSGTVSTNRIAGSYVGITGVGVITTGTWQGGAIADTYLQDNITVSSAGMVDWSALNNYPAACGAGQAITQLGDSVTCAAFAAGSGSGNYIQNQFASAQTTADFWLSGTGRADTALQAPTFDTSGATTLTLGGNATSISVVDDVTLAAGKSLTVTGGNTGSRPAGTEGMVYYDTDTDKLLAFSNGKWQADRTELVIVAASNSSQADKDAADYVADGNTGAAGDGDQVQINAALTAATGRKVVLLAGTYTVDAAIAAPTNTTLTGVGPGSVVTIPNSFNATINIISASGTDTVVENLMVDQNTANQTSGTIVSISSSGSNNTIKHTKHVNVRSTGISMSAGAEATAGIVRDNLVDCTNGDPGASSTAIGISITGSTSNNTSTSTAEGNNVHNCGTGIRAQSRVSVLDNSITAGRTTGIDLQTVVDASIADNNVSMLYGNFSNNFGSSALAGTSVTRSTISGNAFDSAFSMVVITTMNSSVFSNNMMEESANLMLSITTGTNNTITGNVGDDTANQNRYLFSALSTSVVSNNVTAGIFLDSTSHYNQVLSNQINASGTSTSSKLDVGGDNNTVSDNVIHGLGAGLVALRIDTTADSTYLADNRMVNSSGATFLSDSGTNTTYGGQVNSSGNFVIQPAGTVELMKNTNITGTLNVTGNVDTNGSLTVGSADQFVVSNLGVVTAGAWQGTAINDTYVADTLTVDSASSVHWQALNNYPAACGAGQAVTQLGDTVTCSTFAAGSGSGNYIQNQFASAQTTADFWVSGTGRADTALQAPTFDTATAIALTLGGTATSISVVDDVTLAAGKSLTVTGGNTGSRPASPTEGMVYYDTDTDKLLVYSNGKWQADRSDAIIVAASNSSQSDKDAADFVADGNTVAAADGDQVQINQALTAGAGKKVVLLAGSYVVDASISVPNNTIMTGVGNGTVVELADIDATDNLIENTDATTGTGVVIQNMKIDGRSDLNTAGTQHGVYLAGVGTSSRAGATVTGLQITRFRSKGIFMDGTNNSSIRGNHSASNTDGIYIYASFNNTVSSNTLVNNSSGAIGIESATNNVISENTTNSNSYGVFAYDAKNNTISNNSIINSSSRGIELSGTAGSGGSSSNTITGNNFQNNGGATNNNAIYLDASDSNTITSNTINDSSATTDNFAINISGGTSDANYLSSNTLGTGSINDLGTGTIFGGQVNGSGNYLIQPAGTIELMKDTNLTGDLVATGDGTFFGGDLTVTTNTATNDSIVISVSGGGANGFYGTISNADLTAARSWTLPDEDGTFCLQGSASCGFATGSAGSYIQNQLAGAQATSNFWISGTGRADTALQAPTFDTATAATLTLGGNATSISVVEDVTLAAGKSLTITGGTTASRPAGVEGMLYYDTDTDQLLTYANGKWQAESREAVLVAANDSSPAAKAAADYIADGTADEAEINSAIAEAVATTGNNLGSQKVYLFAGTFTIADTISLPNNFTLTGAGKGTILQFAALGAAVNKNMITNTTTGGSGTGITIRDLKLDGNKAGNASGGLQYGIYLNGTGTQGAGNTPGATVTGIAVVNFKTTGIYLESAANNTITNNSVQASGSYNIYANNTNHNFIDNNTITDATLNGIYLNTAARDIVTNNFIGSNANFGIRLDSGNGNTISGNVLRNNTASTANSTIYLLSSDGNSINNNNIVDNGGTGYAIDISDVGSDNNYLTNNIYSGTGATSINDQSGGDTIYAGQVDSSGNYMLQPSGTVELMKNTNVTGTLNVTSNVDTNGSLTVGNANQFVISNTGVVTSGTWQGSAVAGAYGGTGQTTTTIGDLLVGAAGNTWSKLAIGGNGACLTSNGTTAGWGTCTATNLQGTYNASSPATIDLANSKDFTINATDQTVDSNIVFNLQCVTCSASGGRFAIQDAGVDIFTINPNGDIIIGTATNNMTLTASNGYKPVLNGTARNSKKIRLHAEYPSVVLTADGSNNLGTLTSGYDNTSSVRMNYYNWTTTQGSNQDYDIVVQVPLPSDFNGWDGANPLAVTAYTTNTTNGTITLEARDSSDAQICNFVSVTPGSTSTWATNNTACTLSTGTYTAGDYITLRIKLQAPNAGNTRVGNITLNYLSKF